MRSPISFEPTFFGCSLLDLHLTTHHSNMGIQIFGYVKHAYLLCAFKFPSIATAGDMMVWFCSLSCAQIAIMTLPIVYFGKLQCPADLADPDSAAQVRLLAAVEKLNT